MKRKNFLISAILAAASFAVYLFTALPSIYTGDSGEIATAVYTWGIAHPTGFPTYIILAKLFSCLLPARIAMQSVAGGPMLEFAFRLNIFSALAGSLTVGIVFLILRKLQIPSDPPFQKGGRGDFLAAVTAALSLAFGFTFWSHAAALQVYSLTAFFFALAIFTFLHWLETKKNSCLYLLAAFCGIGAGAHLTFLLVLPFIFIFIFLKDKKLITIKRFFIFFALFLIAIAVVYSYIPLRAAQNPELNWGNPSTAENFINYITQRDYSDKIGVRSYESWRIMLKEIGRIFSREFTWLGLIFVLAGAVIIFRKNRPFFCAGLAVIIFNILLLGNYGNNQDIIILWRYFLPSYIIMAVFIATAINTALSGAQAKSKGYLQLLALLFPTIIFFAHFNDLNRRDNFLVQNVTRDIFNSVPQGAILITDGDTLVGSTMYEQVVLGKRKDIVLINDSLFTSSWYQNIKKQELKEKGKKYADNISYLIRDNSETEFFAITNSSPFLKTEYDFFPSGVVYKIYPKGADFDATKFRAQTEDFWRAKDVEFLKKEKFFKDTMTKELVHIYTAALNNFAAYLVNSDSVQEGVEYYEKSLAIGENDNALRNLAGIYNALGDTQKSLEYKARFDALK